jgi:cleavage stimulation factor subunit 1
MCARGEGGNVQQTTSSGGAGSSGFVGGAGAAGAGASDGPPVLRAYHDSEAVSCVQFHPYHTLVASGTKAGISLFNYGKTDTKVAVKQMPSSHPVTSFRFHPTGDYILAGTEDRSPRIYDVSTMQAFLCPSERDFHFGAVTSVAYADEGGIFATSSVDGTVKIWDTATGGCVTNLTEAHKGGPVHSVCFTRNARCLLTAGADAVKIWDLSTLKPLHVMVGCDLTRRPGRAVFSHDEGLVVCPETSSTFVVVWNSRTGKMEARFNSAHEKPLTAVAVSPATLNIATAASDGSVKFWTPAQTSSF